LVYRSLFCHSLALVCRQFLLRNRNYTIIWDTFEIEPINQLGALGFVTISVHQERQFGIVLGAFLALGIDKAMLRWPCGSGRPSPSSAPAYSGDLRQIGRRYFARGCFSKMIFGPPAQPCPIAKSAT
jgi:hypothetical protein